MPLGFDTAEGIRNLSPREAWEHCARGAIILDIRKEYLNTFKRFDVPSVIQIPMDHLQERYQELPAKQIIIVADTAGIQSKEAYIMLREKGLIQLSNLAGGIVEWERDGMPLIIDDSEKLTGSCAYQLRARNKL